MGFKRNERFDRYTPRTPKGRLRNHFKFYQPVGGLKHQIRLMTRAAFQWGVAEERGKPKKKRRSQTNSKWTEHSLCAARVRFDAHLLVCLPHDFSFSRDSLSFFFFFCSFYARLLSQAPCLLAHRNNWKSFHLNAINDSGNSSNKNNGACYYNKKIAVPTTAASPVAVASSGATTTATTTTSAATAATPAKSHQKATKGWRRQWPVSVPIAFHASATIASASTASHHRQ